MKQGIFISYRRSTGSTMARMIYDRIRLEKNYPCFLDVEKLNVGNFRENIFAEMDKCRICLLILSKDALKRCESPDDNVRQEIESAMEKDLCIIPITSEDFVWPETMPEGLEGIKDLNAIPYVQVYSEQFFERLYSFINNVFAEDRAREIAIRNAEISAKTTEISEKAVKKLKTIGQASASTLVDFSKSASDVAKESIETRSVNFSVIGIIAAAAAVAILGFKFLGTVKTVLLLVVLFIAALAVWRISKNSADAGRTRRPAGAGAHAADPGDGEEEEREEAGADAPKAED